MLKSILSITLTLAFFLSLISLSIPAEQAQAITPTGVANWVVTTSHQSQAGDNIKPVSPTELSNRISSLFDVFYNSTKPIVSQLSKLMIAIAGIFIFLGIFTGKVINRAFVAVLAVGFGLLLFYNAESIVSLIIHISEYIFGG